MINIVGHGPSLIGKKLGKEIDKNTVIRLKGCITGTEDFGNRTDILVASTEVMGLFQKTDAREYWAYPKNGSFDGQMAMHVIVDLQRPVMIPLKFINHWNSIFRDSGANHPNVSTGMAAILMAVYRLKEDIQLFGFDTLLNPDIVFDRHPDIPRSGFGDYPDHDWWKENELLEVIQETYGVKIVSGH